MGDGQLYNCRSLECKTWRHKKSTLHITTTVIVVLAHVDRYHKGQFSRATLPHNAIEDQLPLPQNESALGLTCEPKDLNLLAKIVHQSHQKMAHWIGKRGYLCMPDTVLDSNSFRWTECNCFWSIDAKAGKIFVTSPKPIPQSIVLWTAPFVSSQCIVALLLSTECSHVFVHHLAKWSMSLGLPFASDSTPQSFKLDEEQPHSRTISEVFEIADKLRRHTRLHPPRTCA